MENIKESELVRIQSLIYEIRGYKVMVDRDLAKLYGVETKVLNQAVKRNIKRFPEDFMFQLTHEECLRSQFVTLNTRRRLISDLVAFYTIIL
ncbi:MAG: ORF6N domain-containing protein [Bacteroidales bacterium]|nr:ORF6N domain-containing protein [Bacteroidales bacterium]